MKSTLINLSLFVFSAALFFASTSIADTTAGCVSKNDEVDNMFYQVLKSSTGVCFLSAHPLNSTNLKYRDFMWTSEGKFMVFNSYSNGSNSTETGARVFFLFPRSSNIDMDYQINGSETVIKTAGDGLEFRVANDTGKLTAFNWGTVKESALRRDNNGGVELELNQGMVLDTGFALGTDPTSISGKKSQFSNKQGQTCVFKNTELFDYSNDDAIYKHSDAKTWSLIRSRCPNFQLP